MAEGPRRCCRTIATIVCDMTLPRGPGPTTSPSATEPPTREPVHTYFYGDFLHVGDNAGQLIDINSDDGHGLPDVRVPHIDTALAHLYFGFSVLVERALRWAPIAAAE
jgi:hypothetical protein